MERVSWLSARSRAPLNLRGAALWAVLSRATHKTDSETTTSEKNEDTDDEGGFNPSSAREPNVKLTQLSTVPALKGTRDVSSSNSSLGSAFNSELPPHLVQGCFSNSTIDSAPSLFLCDGDMNSGSSANGISLIFPAAWEAATEVGDRKAEDRKAVHRKEESKGLRVEGEWDTATETQFIGRIVGEKAPAEMPVVSLFE